MPRLPRQSEFVDALSSALRLGSSSQCERSERGSAVGIRPDAPFGRLNGFFRCVAERTENFSSMRTHCKIVALALCFGVFLLVYFFGGNSADEPPPHREHHKLPSVPSASGLGKVVSVKVVKPPQQIQPNRKESYKGDGAISKLR